MNIVSQVSLSSLYIKIIPPDIFLSKGCFFVFPTEMPKKPPILRPLPGRFVFRSGSGFHGESCVAFPASRRRGFKTKLKEPKGMTWPSEPTKHWCLGWCLVGKNTCFVGEIGCFSGFTFLYIYIYYLKTLNLRKVC